ncbi:uncharacterized protein LOC143461168 isoform X1 [Clavelina lepadiformis]|uniref:uncharacterized protein LOC143461168 isoform X1 n=1 Tax=Clavelina lepadiformis TaxID=159417 RepID=UPI00404297AF
MKHLIILSSFLILSATNHVYGAQKNICKGPRVRGWKVEDFRLNVTWAPRKCFQTLNVSYDIETSIHESDWEKRSCEVENFGKCYSCIPAINFNQVYFYRVCAYGKNDKAIFCTPFPHHKRKIDLRAETRFSKPIITATYVGRTHISVNIKEPTDHILCEYHRLLYRAYVVPCNDSKMEMGLSRVDISSGDSKNQSCEESGENFNFFLLKPRRDYCVFGRYWTDVKVNSHKSRYAKLNVTTLPEIYYYEHVPSSSNETIVVIVASCGFLFLISLTIFCIAYRRIRKAVKKWTPKIAELTQKSRLWQEDTSRKLGQASALKGIDTHTFRLNPDGVTSVAKFNDQFGHRV